VDNTGLPSGLVMPQLVDYPKEGVDIHLLYPRISSFAASGGTQDQDFYTTPVSQHAYPTPLSPAFPAGTDFPADNMCLDAP
jgi:hypothetical protein